jgi:hypothetical protein
MSKVNDRLMRVILNEFHRILEQSQWLLMIPQVCDPVWPSSSIWRCSPARSKRQIMPRTAANISASIGCPTLGIHPSGPGCPAKRMEVDAGFTSRSAVVAERGESAKEVDQQNHEDQQRAEKLGLRYTAEQSSESGAAPTE